MFLFEVDRFFFFRLRWLRLLLLYDSPFDFLYAFYSHNLTNIHERMSALFIIPYHIISLLFLSLNLFAALSKFSFIYRIYIHTHVYIFYYSILNIDLGKKIKKKFLDGFFYTSFAYFDYIFVVYVK